MVFPAAAVPLGSVSRARWKLNPMPRGHEQHIPYPRAHLRAIHRYKRYAPGRETARSTDICTSYTATATAGDHNFYQRSTFPSAKSYTTAAAAAAATMASSGMGMHNAHKLALIAVSLAAVATLVSCNDPDILTDFVTPPGVEPGSVNGSFFVFRGLRHAINKTQPKFGAAKVSETQFPALTGLGVSTALLEYPPHTVNPPHTHPRATELLYVLEGRLRVGFVDTTNKLFHENIGAGDVFVFPKGLLHFQYNAGSVRAIAYAAFSSANPGTVSAPAALFGSGINDVVLEKAFKVSADIVHQLELPFQAAVTPVPSPSPAPTV